jgi:glutamate-ammonia-ligase adenylyltransferase
MLGELGLIDSKKAEDAATAYRDYRNLQHAIRLQGEGKARVPVANVQVNIKAVQDLWHVVFLNS